MDRKEAENFIKRNRYCDHGHVVWMDGSENEFGVTLRVEDLMKYSSVYEFAASHALSWYPERTKADIKSLRLAG